MKWRRPSISQRGLPVLHKCSRKMCQKRLSSVRISVKKNRILPRCWTAPHDNYLPLRKIGNYFVYSANWGSSFLAQLLLCCGTESDLELVIIVNSMQSSFIMTVNSWNIQRMFSIHSEGFLQKIMPLFLKR